MRILKPFWASRAAQCAQCADEYYPVSYTHLDVYKRQVSKLAEIFRKHDISSVEVLYMKMCIRDRKHTIGVIALANRRPIVSDEVKYEIARELGFADKIQVGADGYDYGDITTCLLYTSCPGV